MGYYCLQMPLFMDLLLKRKQMSEQPSNLTYSKIKQPLKKKTKNLFSSPSIA